MCGGITRRGGVLGPRFLPASRGDFVPSRLRSNRLLALCVAGGCLGVAGSCQGQVTASQQFCVEIASVLSLLPPAGPIAVIHDGSNADQPLATALWPCLANDSDGSTVTFSTLTGFVHTTIPTEVRDVRLTLSLDTVAPGAGWSVTTPTDQTDVGAAIPDIVATVQAESTDAGSATFALDVEFITSDASTLLEGTYCTTIVGTITPN